MATLGFRSITKPVALNNATFSVIPGHLPPQSSFKSPQPQQAPVHPLPPASTFAPVQQMPSNVPQWPSVEPSARNTPGIHAISRPILHANQHLNPATTANGFEDLLVPDGIPLGQVTIGETSTSLTAYLDQDPAGKREQPGTAAATPIISTNRPLDLIAVPESRHINYVSPYSQLLPLHETFCIAGSTASNLEASFLPSMDPNDRGNTGQTKAKVANAEAPIRRDCRHSAIEASEDRRVM